MRDPIHLEAYPRSPKKASRICGADNRENTNCESHCKAKRERGSLFLLVLDFVGKEKPLSLSFPSSRYILTPFA